MNKSIVAIAVAGLAGAIGFTSVASAEATVYGRVVAGAVYADNDEPDDDGAWNFGAVGQDDASTGFESTRFGFKGSTDLGNGMEAGFKIEREIDDGANESQRHNLVYLSGAWGKLTLGHQGNPYMSARKWDQTNFAGGNWGFGSSYREEGVGYSMSSGSFSLDVLAKANSTNVVVTPATDGTTVHYYTVAPAAGATRIVGTTGTGDNNVPGAPLGIVLDANGDVATDQSGATACDTEAPTATCAAGYTLDAPEEDTDGTSNVNNPDPSSLTRVGTGTPANVDDANGIDAWIVRAGYNFGVVNLDVAVQTNQTEAQYGRDNMAIGINGSAGPLDWYLAYQTSELANSTAAGNDDEIDSVGGFLGFNMSERDIIYGYYVTHSADVPDGATTIAYGDGDAVGEDATETIVGYSRQIGPGVKAIVEYAAFDSDTGAAGSDTSKLHLAVKYDF